MLKLDKVKKRYPEFALECSLEVPDGCVTGLIGKNGAGKSTTFKLVLGLIYADDGTIELFGKKRPAGEPVGAREKGQIGVVLADCGFNGYMTVSDVASMLASMYPGFQREFFFEKCKEFDLPKNQKIKEFSTGMKRKLQVITAISHDAKLLVLDEPTAGLDVLARDELLGLLREYMQREGRSVLISSHISGDLENFCDDIYMIDEGKIILHEETDALLDSYALLKMTAQQYQKLDKKYILRRKKESYGISCLTDKKRFYMENYPDLTVEKGSIDELITMMVKGEEV